MTESEWLVCTDPLSMLEFLGVYASDRKLRLFGCACYRRFWALLEIPERRAAIRAAERLADGLVHDRRREKILTALEDDDSEFATTHLITDDPPSVAHWSVKGCCYIAAGLTGTYEGDESVGEDAENVERLAQIGFLRCIFGSPFYPARVDPAWLTQTVNDLAVAAYEERYLPVGELDCEQLAVLADALEEAGCTDQTILDHLRGPGPHVRGCWPVDLVLARE